MVKTNEIVGAVTEHWMFKRLKENKPINLEGNFPRVSAKDLIRLNDYRNELLGTNYSLYDMHKMRSDEVNYQENVKE